MKTLKLVLLSLLVLGTLGTSSAWAYRSHVGVVVDLPLFAPWAYPAYYPPAYYPSPVIVQPPPAPVYSEQPAPPPQQYWHYCPSSKAYYPYVNTCPEGWQRVPSQPPR